MPRKLNLIFMGTPAFALPTLHALAEAGHRMVAVYTAPPRPAHRGQKETPSPVHAFAVSKNIPVYTPLTLKDMEVQRQFAAHNADAAIVAAYGLLLPKAILEATPFGCINVHPSLLPRWRGAAPIQRTLMAGDAETGVVIMKMDAGLDTGDMLMTHPYSIPPRMNAGELQNALAEMAAPMVVKALEGLVQGNIIPMPQPQEGITYAQKISKSESRIQWHEAAQVIRQKILGLAPYPGACFIYKGENVKVLDANIQPASGTAGMVIDNSLTVACGEQALGSFILQRPGKKPMPAAELLKGYSIPAGTLLE